MVAEIRGMCPVLEVGRGIDPDYEVLRVGDDHYPGGFRMPDYFRVAELSAVDRDHGVAGVFCECVAAVVGVGNLLHFFVGGVEGVDCDYPIGLVGEEAAGIVYINDRGSREYAFALCTGVDGYGLVLPVV